MEEKRLGRYYHSETETEWHVVKWGSHERQKNVDENRLTRNALNNSEYTTFAVLYPDGKVKHLSFAGVLPSDLDSLADYWMDIESL